MSLDSFVLNRNKLTEKPYSKNFCFFSIQKERSVFRFFPYCKVTSSIAWCVHVKISHFDLKHISRFFFLLFYSCLFHLNRVMSWSCVYERECAQIVRNLARCTCVLCAVLVLVCACMCMCVVSHGFSSWCTAKTCLRHTNTHAHTHTGSHTKAQSELLTSNADTSTSTDTNTQAMHSYIQTTTNVHVECFNDSVYWMWIRHIIHDSPRQCVRCSSANTPNSFKLISKNYEFSSLVHRCFSVRRRFWKC